MKKIKLFAVFVSLSKDDLRKVKKCVQSPIFNQRKEVELLFNQLRKHHPNLSSTSAFRQKIYSKIYPRETFNEYKFNKLTYELLEVIHHYFLYRHSQRNEIERDTIIAKAYHEQDLFKTYTKKNLLILEKIEQYSVLDARLMGYKLPILRRLMAENQITHENIEKYRSEFINTLNLQYIYQKKLMQIDSEILKSTVNFKEEPFYLSKAIIEEQCELPTNIQLFEHLSNLMKNKQEEAFLKVQNEFMGVSDHLTYQDRTIIFGHLVSFLVKELNNGKQKYISTMFDLYKYGLEHQILISPEGKIDTVTFQNITTSAILNKAFSWGEQFIENYYKKLETGDKEQIRNISVTTMLFYQKKHLPAIEFSLDKTFKGVHQNLTMRGIICRSYFELCLRDPNYYQLFIYDSLAFQKFLKRTSIPAQKRERYENLLKFLTAIIKAMNKNKNIQPIINKWEDNLHAGQPIALKTWVLEKIVTLKN